MSTTEVTKIEELTNTEYKYGFVTEIEAETFAKGLNEGIIRQLSAVKNEPDWMTEWRLKAYNQWLTVKEPLGKC
jgi:Fe-S cluster assembly protein SufB